ncbi:malate dehydrogenase [Halobellus captivus]|uniref:malate dehydrogenase n=1 Tax=Halobellus captivus TaxID=2592614 RepID=UPI0011A78B2D|nr:lactate dehydrogenase [Halobellus captivus]
MHVGIIGGASTIGSTLAYSLVCDDPSNSITLFEKSLDAAWGHTTDLTHANYHSADAPRSPPAGHTTAADTDAGSVTYAPTEEIGEYDLDAVVITARVPPREDDTQRSARGARSRELEANVPLIDAIAQSLDGIDPVPTVVVTNPVDRIVYRLWTRLGWDRSKFLGFSLAETARVADAIARRYEVHPTSVSCPTMGEHGEHVVPVFSRASIGGEPISLSPDERDEIVTDILEIPFEIAKKRGLQDSSRWVSGAGLLRVLRTISSPDLTDPLCLSTVLDGEYGFEDGCLSIPVTLTADGIDRRIEWDLPDSERKRLREAHDAIWTDIERIES